MLKSTLLIALLVLSVLTKAQKQDSSNENKTMPFQLSFITPLGTNGMQSHTTTNNVSINIIAGFSGGLDGVELSGFMGGLSGDMKGAQFAGFANMDLGKSEGLQAAGFMNYNKSTFKGVQLAGFANNITDNASGFQASGFTNIITGSFDGAQFTGFANINTDNSSGAQFAGFVNTVDGTMDGFQAAGFMNYSAGNSVSQLSGFTNISIGDNRGMQLTGFANVNTGRLIGVQIAGFLNTTQKLNGFQLAAFNVVDSLEHGVSIGILSFVKNGYKAFELSASESMHAMTSFKTGTDNFYNILSVGARFQSSEILWGWGYGIGTLARLSEKSDLSIELRAYHINEGEWFTNRLNLLNQFQMLYNRQILPQMGLFGGPVLNVVASSITDEYGFPVESKIAPYDFYNEVHNGTRIQMYLGVNLGVRF